MSGQSAVRQPTPLPPFQYDWTGKDIAAIHALVGTVYGYVQPSLEVVSTLDGTVDGLVHAAGWQGQAAEAFKKAWEKDSTEAVALTELMNGGGEILDKLALSLAWIQIRWENSDPDPQKAKNKGRELAEAHITQAVRIAVQDLGNLTSGPLARAARKDIQDGTISNADQSGLQDLLTDSLDWSPKPPGPGIDTKILSSHTVLDMTGGAIIGGTAGGIFGGLPGAGIGGIIGGAAGGLWGLGEDLHFW